MRPKRQVKIISSQLELLEEIKTELESVLEFTNNAIQRGNLWMEGTNNETFFEMNTFLTDGNFECVRRCQDISKEKNEECHGRLKEQNTSDTRTKSTDTLITNKPLVINSTEEKEYKELFKKCQELDKTISKNYRKLQKLFEEHKNETKETLFKERQEMETEFKNKWNKIWKEFEQASNFMSGLKTENEDVNKQIFNLQEQIKEHEQKSETFMERHKSTENSFSLRLDDVIEQQKTTENGFSLRLNDVMKDILANTESINKLKSDSETLSNVVNGHTKTFDTSITNLNEKLKDLEENFQSMDNTFKEIEDKNKTKFDDNTLKSKELIDKIVNVSNQVDIMDKELKLSSQQVCFFAVASIGAQENINNYQIITSFDRVFNNTGNLYDPTKGIFTAPCDGLYLFSLTLRFEIGENVEFCIMKKSSSRKEYICALETTTINSSSSVTGLVNLKLNDQLYIVSMDYYKIIKLHCYSYFMCTLLNKD